MAKDAKRKTSKRQTALTASDDPESLLTAAFGGVWRIDGGPDELGRQRIAQFGRDAHGRSTVTGVLVVGGPVTADYLRSIPIRAWENSGSLSNSLARSRRREIDALPPLNRERGQPPAEFSELFALHYRAWAAIAPHPARAIADRWNTPLPTVHGWVREARLRHLLPPGDRRKRIEGGADVEEK